MPTFHSPLNSLLCTHSGFFYKERPAFVNTYRFGLAGQMIHYRFTLVECWYFS